MLIVIRKIAVWLVGLPILLILMCFITIANILTSVAVFFLKGISILAIIATGVLLLVKAMPINTQLIPMLLLSVVMFWIPELMAIPMAGAMLVQRIEWEFMTE